MVFTNELLNALKSISNYGRWREGRYEVAISEHCRNVQIGTFSSEEEGHDKLLQYRCKTIEKSINELGLNGLRYRVYKDNYIVFENGVILNLYGLYLSQSIDRCGYAEISINGHLERVHRIVATCFVNDPENKPCVNHKNGNKLSNHSWNLEWVTHSENTIHAFESGLQKAGEAVNTSKLTEKDVLFIRENYKVRDPIYGRKALSKKFNVSVDTISDIVNSNTWRYL